MQPSIPSPAPQAVLSADLPAQLRAACPALPFRMEGGRVFASPRSTEEVAAVLGSATALGVSVEPCGSASKLAWRNAANSPLVIETTSLNRVLEHTWQDMTCTVEAGCTWSALQASLAQHHQFVALDPLWPQRATIGGIIATNDSGALRLKYGSLRDLIIGMTIVLSDGTIARSGGKVVKNVAGYDLHKLMTGAFGTLGLITEVTFRLHAVPQHALNLSIPHTSPEAVGALLLRLLDTHLSLQAMQLRGIGDNFTLDVQLASLPAALDTQRASVMAMAAELGLTPQPAQPDIWQARQNLFSDETAILCKATMLPSNIAAAAAAIHAMGGDSVTQATGIMTAAIQIASAEKLIALRRDLERSGGSLVILQQPPSGSLDRWGTPPDSLPLMRNLKQQFDPARTLNPGSFLGGI